MLDREDLAGRRRRQGGARPRRRRARHRGRAEPAGLPERVRRGARGRRGHRACRCVEPDLDLEEADEDGGVGRHRRGSRRPTRCPDYLARIIRGVDATGHSPLRVQARLTASGMRPVSERGRRHELRDARARPAAARVRHGAARGPGHRRAATPRTASASSPSTTSSARSTHEDLLICDLERPVGARRASWAAPPRRSPTPPPTSCWRAPTSRGRGVLRTARRLDLHSEASHRFERGTDPEGLERGGATRCAKLIVEWAGGTVLRGVARAGRRPTRALGRDAARARRRRCSATRSPRTTPGPSSTGCGMPHRRRRGRRRSRSRCPGYRVDIEREVDLIEEVARMQGYDRIGSTVPSAGQAGGRARPYAFRERVRDALVRAGLREVRLLSFASGDDLALTGDADAIAVANPLAGRRGVPADPAHARAAARRRPRTRHGARTPSRSSRSGTVFRMGDPVEERPKVAFALARPGRSRAGPTTAARSTSLDAKGVLEALMAELGDRGLGARATRSTRRSTRDARPSSWSAATARRCPGRAAPRARPSLWRSRAGSRSPSSRWSRSSRRRPGGVRVPRRAAVPAGAPRSGVRGAEDVAGGRGRRRAHRGGGRRPAGATASCSTSSGEDPLPDGTQEPRVLAGLPRARPDPRRARRPTRSSSGRAPACAATSAPNCARDSATPTVGRSRRPVADRLRAVDTRLPLRRRSVARGAHGAPRSGRRGEGRSRRLRRSPARALRGADLREAFHPNAGLVRGRRRPARGRIPWS